MTRNRLVTIIATLIVETVTQALRYFKVVCQFTTTFQSAKTWGSSVFVALNAFISTQSEKVASFYKRPKEMLVVMTSE